MVAIPTTLHHLTHQLRVYSFTNDGFHHGEMLKVVVGLEKSIAREELDKDTSYAPDITGETPAKVEDDFWRSVMSGRDN